MKKMLRVYVAGKVNKNSSFGTEAWRDSFCEELGLRSGFVIQNLDPTKSSPSVSLDEGNSRLIFGRDCYMIQQADFVVVYLSDDISVGGSQEMLIAKYFRKPLIGIAPYGGKFNRSEKEIAGRLYRDYVHPYVKMPCDWIVGDVVQAADVIRNYFGGRNTVKSLNVIDESINYYKKELYPRDHPLHFDAVRHEFAVAHKGVIVDSKQERMLVVRYADKSDVSEKVRGKLGLPGGKVCKANGERREFAVRAWEETGITIKPLLPFSTWEFSYEQRQTVYDVVCIGYLSKFESGEIREPIRGNESDLECALWLRMDKVMPDDFVHEERETVQKFFAYSRCNPFIFA